MRSELASRASVARAREEGERGPGFAREGRFQKMGPLVPRRVPPASLSGNNTHNHLAPPSSKMSQLLWLAGFRTPSDCLRSAGICPQETEKT